jgi:REP element-mobilizing transposase RayT
MNYDRAKHNRRSLRLKGYDYSSSGAYFLTICTHQRQCLFGEIVDREMQLNQFGNIASKFWQEIPAHFSKIELDGFVVMPNHIHGILVMNNDEKNAIDLGRGKAQCQTPTNVNLVDRSLVLYQQLLVRLNLLPPNI